MLSAIKMIKLHAWEDYFRAKVDARRAEEYSTLRSVTALNCVNICLLWLSPQVGPPAGWWPPSPSAALDMDPLTRLDPVHIAPRAGAVPFLPSFR